MTSLNTIKIFKLNKTDYDKIIALLRPKKKIFFTVEAGKEFDSALASAEENFLLGSFSGGGFYIMPFFHRNRQNDLAFMVLQRFDLAQEQQNIETLTGKYTLENILK